MEFQTAYIGIDPGKSGGIACLHGHRPASHCAMPKTPTGLATTLRHVTRQHVTQDGVWFYVVAVENVGTVPGKGHVGAMSFGKNIGHIEGVLATIGLPFISVTPQTWQKSLGCLTGGQKNISKARAQELFPAVTMTHAIADAYLLAEYARRLHLSASQRG